MVPSFQVCLSILVLVFPVAIAGAQQDGTLIVTVRSNSGGPAPQVEVTAGGQAVVTDDEGHATLQVPAGPVEIHLERYGFASKNVRVIVPSGQAARITIELEAEAVVKEEISVMATRSDVLIEDEPLKVEVLDKDEVEEKTAMTPGDVAMLLNETSGLRVQVTSPSLGAANVRVQGLRGRYTQILADGLPLYGQTGSIGILQIPPVDLGRVEVIKGVASALYGSSALGGVINLVSRQPKRAERELLFNGTSRKGSDNVFWLADPAKKGWGYSVLGGAHFQGRSDIDKDGWPDLPAYNRGVLRPRFYWDNGSGDSLFITTGSTIEDRAGGSSSFPEQLRTRRFDTGLVGRYVVGNKLISIRGSAMTQHLHHQFGPTLERDHQETYFAETALSGATSGHSWAVGSAVQVDSYRSHEVSRFDYTYATPALFGQDEFSISSHISLSASGRADFHSKYGNFFNPRLSTLVKLPDNWTLRVSSGTGVFAPTPLTEETEAVGLSRVQPSGRLEAERAWSSSADLGWKKTWLELHGTIFTSNVRHAVRLNESMQIVNSAQPTRTAGSEILASFRAGDINMVIAHTYTRSSELDFQTGARNLVPLTPKHTATFDFLWEQEGKGRFGLEGYYTGSQRLEYNPYRDHSIPYWVFGVLFERRFGALRFFINGENLADFRQTRYDPLVRPTQNFDGRWTVDAWSPLEGRVINAGVRFGL
jgi:outer membrane receptor for ferrienterochelin and colicins